MNKVKVCHITTAHPQFDVRIFQKECRSLAQAGFDVTLLSEKGEDGMRDGVTLRALNVEYSGRFGRFVKVTRALYEEALSMDADIYHFHDPEFLWFGLKLSKKGKKVIFDSHEDVPRQILTKHWIPGPIRKAISHVFETFEDFIVKRLTAVIVPTDFISERFKKVNPLTVQVRNYPVLDWIPEPIPIADRQRNSLYIGNIMRHRGIIEIVDAAELSDLPLEVAGKFDGDATLESDSRSRPGWSKVNFHGFVGQDQIAELLRTSTAGLVTLHPTINYQTALPIKMFEYMAAGLPVVVSNIPLWKEIVEEVGCGIAVDPYNPKEIAEAITRINTRLDESQIMSEAGRKAALEKYNWTSQARNLVELYKAI